ncbi:unnamed protein product [Symbiodinium natans]|uniref:Uncharacterized protein n=1 Tax=Symbiodinium natans TaxID=878477 RepID=A0A812LAS2_9DINO|nr:unnamed protein product [Symbiodinium natans]
MSDVIKSWCKVTQLVALAAIASEHPPKQLLEEYLQAMASLQEEQLAKTKEFLQTLQARGAVQVWNRQHHEQAEKTEAAEERSPPTTTRKQLPDISLELAARNGDVAALAAWRQAGADLSAELDSDSGLRGWTPAHYAAREGHAAALKFLQEAGHCRAAAAS